MKDRPHVHVVGVGGVGMSALAEALLAQGYQVTGSDRSLDQGLTLEATDVLKAAGVELVRQDGSAVTPRTAAVAVSTAIEAGNPDTDAARRCGVELVHRAALLARLAQGKRLVAITGTAGKTTVTAMVGHLLEQAGLDPTVVNGGVVLNWRGPARLGNVRIGRSDLWVLEADESDRSLLHFHPEVAVITNVSKDHFELAEVASLFRAFAGQVRGDVIAGEGVGELLGIRTLEPRVPAARAGRDWAFTYEGVGFRTALPGRHNAENAVLAVALCHRLGADVERLRDALASFRGVHRRLEVVGERGGARVMDDYAHNPAKLAASWRAAAETAERVHGYWRPHGYGPLALMKDDLVEAFAGVCRTGDRLFILPVYYAGGTASKTVTSEDLVRDLKARGVPAEFASNYAALERVLRSDWQAGDTVLGMGARDPELPRFARQLAGEPET